MSTLNASSVSLDAAIELAVNNRLSHCAELNSDLARTHRRLLMQLGAARDTVTWEFVVDAPPALVWDAAAGTIESFLAHLPNVGSVVRLDGASNESGSRVVMQNGATGVAGERMGEVLVALPGRMIAVSDVDPLHPGAAGTLPTLHGLSIRADECTASRTAVTLSSVTAGTYHMWQLPVLMAQAESIRTRVAEMTGTVRSGNIVQVDFARRDASDADGIPIRPIVQMNSNRLTKDNTSTKMIPQLKHTVLRLSRWIVRFAALSIFATIFAATAIAGTPRFELGELYDLLEHRGPYQYDHRYSRIYLVDDVTDRVMVSVTVDVDGSLKLYGVIGRVGRMEAERKADVRRTIEVFNFRSNAGTMSYDESTGEIRISTRITPSDASSFSAADRVVAFTDIVNAEAGKFASAVASGVSYCTIMCQGNE